MKVDVDGVVIVAVVDTGDVMGTVVGVVLMSEDRVPTAGIVVDIEVDWLSLSGVLIVFGDLKSNVVASSVFVNKVALTVVTVVVSSGADKLVETVEVLVIVVVSAAVVTSEELAVVVTVVAMVTFKELAVVVTVIAVAAAVVVVGVVTVELGGIQFSSSHAPPISRK